MARNYFIFKDETSEMFPIVVNKTPAIVTPVKRVETITVNGRDGNLLLDHGTYEPINLSVELTARTTDINEIRRIAIWLEGSGKLTFSREPDLYYKARVVNSISFERLFKYGITKFIVQFECFPFMYEHDNTEINIIPSDGERKIYNHTNIHSKPIITVYGNGKCNVIINGKTIKLDIDGHITLDCELEEAYKDSTNANMQMSGEFPILEQGFNTISCSPGILRIDVLPNFRWR